MLDSNATNAGPPSRHPTLNTWLPCGARRNRVPHAAHSTPGHAACWAPSSAGALQNTPTPQSGKPLTNFKQSKTPHARTIIAKNVVESKN